MRSSLNLCSDDHEEVCYSGTTCPVCELKKELDGEIADLQAKFDQTEKDYEGELASRDAEVTEAENKASELQAQNDELEKENASLKSAIMKLENSLIEHA